VGLGAAIAVHGRPDPELGRAASVEVHERMGETTSYRLQYPVDIAHGDLTRLSERRLGPGSDLAVLVPLGGTFQCLVKGPVRGQQIRLEHGGAGSSVDVEGADSSVAMDRETKSVLWSDVSDSAAVTSILSDHGYLADVESTSGGHFEEKHTLVQRDSDLRFVRRLARRNGCMFWVTSDALGTETAHFRRPRMDGRASAALLINLDPPSTGSIQISWDVERPTSVEGAQLDLGTKKDLDGAVRRSPARALGSMSLDEITGDTRSVALSAPADDSGDLTARGEGALIEAGWFVRLTCQTSVERLGALLRPCTLVDVRGAGRRHSGTYLVAAVHHTIDPTVHLMDVELVRNGWDG
jgi:hypothetical protein